MNKKITTLLLMMMCAGQLYAQNQQGIGIHFGAFDFYGPQTGDYFFVDKNRVKFKGDNATPDTIAGSSLMWHPLVKATYWFQLNKHFDINLALSTASVQYPNSNPDSAYINRRLKEQGTNREHFYGALDARVNFNILPREEYIVTPYVFAGIGATHHTKFIGANLPAGIGANVMLKKDLYLNLETGYRVALTSKDQNHLQHTVGFVYWFKPGYKQPKVVDAPPPPPDMDGDGVTDSIDLCPTIAGLPQYAGCPDSDNDGIADNVDACPLVPGVAQYNGCPDTDGDGIPDQKDKCPYQAGLAQYDGCPPPDRDKDGINDDVDRCPDVLGTAANQGCPEIRREVIERVEKAARSVYFETGKATLKKASFKSLDQIVAVMKEDPSLRVDIGGHTDDVGADDMNMKLSDDRANSCRNYLIGKGIAEDRITAKGYGETVPVADNKTAVGRAQNRRTEFKLRNY